MKKINFFLTLIFLLNVKSFANDVKIVATTTFIKDLVENITGKRYKVVSIMPVGGDPHIYDAVPQDAKTIADADIIFRNGLYLEGWLDKLIYNSGTKAEIVTVSNGVETIISEDYHDAPDPHAWMDVSYAKIYVYNITRALSALIPENAEYFSYNLNNYLTQLEELDKYVFEQIKLIPEDKRIMITSHDAFRYYGNRYGLRVESALGTSTDADVQIKDINNLIRVIKENNLPSIFIESTINPKLLQQLSSDLGISIGGKLFADSLGDEESGADTYIKMITHNTETLVAGLTGKTIVAEDKESFLGFIITVLLLFLVAFAVVSFKLIKRKTISARENAAIEIKGLTVSYGRKTVLTNLYLQLLPGKLYGLIGPNGAGKSTLIKAILDLIPIESGLIEYDGNVISQYKNLIAYIQQKEDIDWNFPATVKDIVLLGRYPHKKVFENLTKNDFEAADLAMEKVGIKDLENKQIGELSGGQQQRVFLARALCQEAAVYLFDEPFVGVDITTEEKMIDILKQLAAEGKTILVIHHDLSKVEDYFEMLIMLNQRVVAMGHISEVFTTENIKNTYSSRQTLLEETEEFIYK
jgi:ABC-type Mn2+/Zn2+ transport system ATPase subunit/ABC-type Zn uptake system ZnuABC Zn-binding protein ZnuA